jgi:hypothetical protein
MKGPADGGWNRVIGYLLLFAGLAITPSLDARSFSQPIPRESNSQVLQERHAQGVVLAMAIMQLAVGRLLATDSFSKRDQSIAGVSTALGSVLYAAGYCLDLGPGFVIAGGFLNLAGIAYLIARQPTGRYAREIRLILPVVAFGMLLNLASALPALAQNEAIAEHLGDAAGLRRRMLRLARVAALALSVLTLLYYGISSSSDPFTDRFGGILIVGAVGMPLVLTAAALFWIPAKYLLPLPATAAFVGVVAAWLSARRTANRLEQAGWLTILVSLSVGLLMGLYAFDGPFPTPRFLGSYMEHARRLSWTAHSYAVVLGIIAVFLAREIRGTRASVWIRLSATAYAVGAIVMVTVLLIGMITAVPPLAFALGPILSIVGVTATLVLAYTDTYCVVQLTTPDEAERAISSSAEGFSRGQE